MNLKKYIPNTITCLNLLCGCIGIIFAMRGDLSSASWLIGLAAVLDFFDGFAARMLKVHSEIGKQLDSLADMVTFGVLPGILMFQLISKVEDKTNPIVFIALLIPVFSAIRLAKFNIDTRQSESFIGVPTPANAILIASFPLITQTYNFLTPIILTTYFLISVSLIMSYMLVAQLPLFALKFKTFHWSDNRVRYLFLGSSFLLLCILQFVAVPFIILLYILLSVANNFSKKLA